MTSYVLTIAQQKGGAGKTTLAAHLGVQFARVGHRVALVDIDPQGSLTQWYRQREKQLGEAHTGISFSNVSGWRVGSEVQKLRREHDLILIDSPPHTETEARTAIRHADLLLVPVQPSPVDLWATQATLLLASAERVPVKIVLNRVLYNSRLAALIASGLPGLTRHFFGNRVLFASSLLNGLTSMEVDARSAAALEVEALAREIADGLRKKTMAYAQPISA